MSEKKRKTRLKGTENKKPCFDCGKTKDRFKDFKPRWAGCVKHRTDRGRRYFQTGCAECEKIVNGNIRQPRCIECDKSRPKKVAGQAAPIVTPEVSSIAALAAVVTEEPPVALPEAVVEAKSQVAVEQGGVDVPITGKMEPEDLTGLPEVEEVEEDLAEPEPEPEPVVVETPEPEAPPAPQATAVVVPPAAPAVPTPRKKVANKADLFALFSGEVEPTSDPEATKGPF